jgi:hypothetical protein
VVVDRYNSDVIDGKRDEGDRCRGGCAGREKPPTNYFGSCSPDDELSRSGVAHKGDAGGAIFVFKGLALFFQFSRIVPYSPDGTGEIRQTHCSYHPRFLLRLGLLGFLFVVSTDSFQFLPPQLGELSNAEWRCFDFKADQPRTQLGKGVPRQSPRM